MFFPTYLWTYPVQMILSPSTMTPLTPPCFEESVEIQDQINFPVKNYKFIGKIFLSFVHEKQEGHIMTAKSEKYLLKFPVLKQLASCDYHHHSKCRHQCITFQDW